MPTGPDRVASVKVRTGVSELTVALLIGETGTGALMTIGVKTLKLDAGENAPVLAPSCACARQSVRVSRRESGRQR